MIPRCGFKDKLRPKSFFKIGLAPSKRATSASRKEQDSDLDMHLSQLFLFGVTTHFFFCLWQFLQASFLFDMKVLKREREKDLDT